LINPIYHLQHERPRVHALRRGERPASTTAIITTTKELTDALGEPRAFLRVVDVRVLEPDGLCVCVLCAVVMYVCVVVIGDDKCVCFGGGGKGRDSSQTKKV
jgi:hypothetical protein